MDRRENERLSTMDSIESRSVFQDEDKSKIEDEEDNEDFTPRIGMDSDDDDNSEQRLIRQALGSIPSMSKHLRSQEHNGTTLRWEYVMEYSSDINFLLGGQKLPPSSVIEDPKTVLKKVEEPTCLKSAWELLEIFYADMHSQAWMPERLLDWIMIAYCLELSQQFIQNLSIFKKI